jgi:hypothetical protein
MLVVNFRNAHFEQRSGCFGGRESHGEFSIGSAPRPARTEPRKWQCFYRIGDQLPDCNDSASVPRRSALVSQLVLSAAFLSFASVLKVRTHVKRQQLQYGAYRSS